MPLTSSRRPSPAGSPGETSRPPEKDPALARSPTLVLGFEVRWIAGVDGVPRPLGQALSRIVMALVDRYNQSPEATLTLEELLEAGWPGERLVAEAGANRVYVALAQLRRMGLRSVIERGAGGYRLAPHTEIRLVAPRSERDPISG